MKKFFPLILFCMAIAMIPLLGATSKKDKNLLEAVIEKIEKKYHQLREQSPFVKAKGKPVAQSMRFIQPDDQVIQDYSKLRQIALIRHGEPDMIKSGKYTSDEANMFLKCYDSVCIIVPEKAFFEVGEKEEIKVFSSPLNRALTTAHYLFGTDKDISISPEFREFENKIEKSDSDKKKSMKFWKATARVKWMLGLGKNNGIESFRDAKKRAKRSAQILADASETNQKVLLTGHGFLNRYIKKNLKKMGWHVVEDTGSDYFGTTILVKIDK